MRGKKKEKNNYVGAYMCNTHGARHSQNKCPSIS
jgi:hypothetical protein